MVWKDEVTKLLLTFYNTIEPAADPSVMSKKAWHKVDASSEPVFYDQQSLLTATWCLAENKAIANKYSKHALSSLIADKLATVFLNEPDKIQIRIDDLVRYVSNASPVTMNVYMDIQGVSISKRVRMGIFEFIPANERNGIEASTNSPHVQSDKTDLTCKDQDLVMVSVEACESGKAQEKAYAEFQWLENAIRLFACFDYCDVGITSFKGSSIENSFVTTVNGEMVGGSSSVKGAVFPVSLEKDFAPDRPSYRVIDKLGCNQNKLTELQKRIRHAVYLGGLSVHETVPEVSYFLCVSALEALFQVETDKYVNPSIAQQIVESFCFLVADKDRRRKTFEEMRLFYRKRSAVGHGGKIEVSKRDVWLVQVYLRAAVIQLIDDPILSNLKTPEDLAALVRDKKFGLVD